MSIWTPRGEHFTYLRVSQKPQYVVVYWPMGQNSFDFAELFEFEGLKILTRLSMILRGDWLAWESYPCEIDLPGYQGDRKIRISQRILNQNKNILTHWSVSQKVSNYEKTESRRSPWTVPLNNCREPSSRAGNWLIGFLSELIVFGIIFWANRSRSLICHEQPERFAHGRSFVLSDLSDSLTVSHLSWAIWANHSQ